MNRFSLPDSRLPILLLWSLFVFLYGIQTNTLYRTESLRAMIARETLDGSWLVPRLYGEPFLTKPPGMYVAIAICSLPFGEVTEFSARLPSVIAGVVSVWAFFLLLRSVCSFREAWLLSLLMPVSLLWLDKSPSAEIDSLQVMWVLLAMVCFQRTWHRLPACEGSSQAGSLCHLLWWSLALLCVTAGFLTKWTAPAFFYLTVIPYLLITRRGRLLFSKGHLLGVLLASLLVGIWVVAVSTEVGFDLLYETVRKEAMQRVGGEGGSKGLPWLSALTFAPLVIATNLPWAFLAMLSLLPKVRNSLTERERDLWRLGHGWLWPNLLFWSMMSQHHVRYVFPLTPAFALLGSLTMLALARQRSAKFLPRWVLVGCLFWFAVKVVAVELILPERTRHRHVRETAQTLRDLIPEKEMLYHAKLKDEGLLFYFARPSRKFEPGQKQNVYALLIEAEWQDRARFGQLIEIAPMRDQQGDPIHLVYLGEKPP